MKVLHICNDFAGSKVHASLVRELDLLGVEQVVYCPVRDKRLLERNQFESHRVQFVYSYVIRPWYKFFYFHKRNRLYADLKSKVDLSKIDLVHASTLFSDGGIAYLAQKEFGIPFVSAVRAVDLIDFVGMRPYLLHWGRKYLLAAQKLYFISPWAIKMFRQMAWIQSVKTHIENKIQLQCNGIDTFWFQHVSRMPHEGKNILYVGSFESRKNVPTLINAVSYLRENGFPDLQLTVVGGGKDENHTQQSIERHSSFVHFLGRIDDKNELVRLFQQHALFAMVSWNETFGLVYLEALSQNLPVVYVQGQGIDGLFDEEHNPVGVAANPRSVKSIADAISQILCNPGRYSNQQVNFEDFEWKNIAVRYLQCYQAIENSLNVKK
ncbi:MAG: glycosyltransferase family 4 protein [Bacteroidales bacterium]|nr:glycosyltransferase family 4 protein [Bacteroidales bacterium]